jgi:hypothetical protein
MSSSIVVRNEDVERIQAFIPEGHRHVRVAVRFRCGLVLILQHATLDALTRAFLSVSLHPTRKATELVGDILRNRKPGFAKYQLIESGRDEEEVVNEGTELLIRAGDLSLICEKPCLEPKVSEDGS